MPLTKASFAVIQVANNVTSTTVGNSTSIPSITFDQNGVISAVSNTTLSVPANTTITTPTISGNLSLDSTGTTGVRVPSANTLAFHTAGTEDMRITSAGDVGIGTANPGQKLEVLKAGGGAIRISETASRYVEINGYGEGSANGSVMAFNTITAGTSSLVERGRFDNAGNFLFNSGYGSVATAYGCRAWVNFNGTGTPAIRSRGNVSSLTDNGTGDYTINFATDLVDNNYACVFSGMRDADGNGSLNTTALKSGSYGNTVSTGSVRVLSENDSGTRVDVQMYTAAFFR